ncbi:MAG: hypothetical protein GF334_00205 [Candidatus Altiarchaeales archaeon]|nr:hypothetical protein [Candidatus Altiarchaeales archaeon]
MTKHKQLYVRTEHEPILEAVKAHLREKYGPNSGMFSTWMWEAAQMRLAAEGGISSREKRLLEEIAALVNRILDRKLSNLSIQPSEIEPVQPDDPDLANLLGGKINWTE